MKKIFLFNILTATILFMGCKKNEPFKFDDTMENVSIYMPLSVSKPVINKDVPLALPGEPDTAYINFGSYFGGYQNAPVDVETKFVVDWAALDTLNTKIVAAGEAPYEKLPDSVVVFSTLKATIMAGKHSSEVIRYGILLSKVQLGRKYALPLTLSTANGGYQIHSTLKTTIWAIKITDPLQGNYNATGTFNHPTGGIRNINQTKFLESQGNKTYKTGVGDLGSNFFMLLKINSDNSVTISPSGVTPNIDQTLGPNTYDPATKKFTLNYSYNTAAPRIIAETLIKQ